MASAKRKELRKKSADKLERLEPELSLTYLGKVMKNQAELSIAERKLDVEETGQKLVSSVLGASLGKMDAKQEISDEELLAKLAETEALVVSSNSVDVEMEK